MLPPFVQWILPRRLDRQVMLVVSLLLGLVLPFFAVHEADENTARLVRSVTLQARALAENVAVTSVEHIVTQDFASTEQLLLRSARFPGVLDIQVTNVKGRVVGDVVVKPGGEPKLRYKLNPLSPPGATSSYLQQRDGRLVIWEPVVGAYPVGWVRLNYSLAESKRISREYLYDYLIDGTIMAVLLITLILLVMRQPLRMLRDAATFAARLKDKSGVKIPVDRRSVEIEQLGMALNEASTNLFEQETAIKQAMKALNTQKSAMDEHSIVSITDVDGRITYANQKLLDVTGYSSEELLGKTYSLIKSGHHSDAFFRDMWATISSGYVWHGEILNKSKYGHEVWMNTTIVPFMDESGTPYEYVAISTDVTKQKQVEQELEQKAGSLKQMTDHLEDLVRQRTIELERANLQLQHLNKIKSEFVSVVSHELRTPLTSIKSFAEILNDDLEELDLDEQKNFLSIINEESDRLGRLINDLLDLQKMDSGKMVWKDEIVNLGQVLESYVSFFLQSYSEKGVELQLDNTTSSCCLIEVDVDRIKQLITNLLSNALKFTEHGGVKVTMSSVPGEVMVSVCDTGLGIPESELENVFENFHQVDRSETRKIGGSGLGLAICKDIVQHYGGRIWAESTLGEGSCFSFTFPCRQLEGA
jgi:two-component system sensor histidine kinase/response regulator